MQPEKRRVREAAAAAGGQETDESVPVGIAVEHKVLSPQLEL